MPRGISRAKHPELYANKKTTTAKKPGIGNVSKKLVKDMKTVARAGKARMLRPQTNLDDVTKFTQLTGYVNTLTAIKNNNDIRDLLDEEIGDSVELLSDLRKRIFGEAPSAKQELQTQTQAVTTPAQPQVTTPAQPVFTPPQQTTEQFPAQH